MPFTGHWPANHLDQRSRQMQPRSANPSPARARLSTVCQWRVAIIPLVLVADCGYGEVGELRGGLDDREIACVVSQVFALSRSFLVPS
jgi:hypothetical protein